MIMEKKLKKLFDYQQFEKNEKLEKLIRETESRNAKELSDDDLTLVNAAGEPETDVNIGGSYMPNGTQVVGLSGGISGENNSGSVSGYNTGGLAGSLSDEVGGLIGSGGGIYHTGTGGGGGGAGAGGNGTAM